MAKGFTLEINPWVYLARYTLENAWTETYIEKEHLTPAAEEKLPEAERAALLSRRNSFPELPLVNYTTQYGLGCFEGLKAFPQKAGGLAIFRPDGNARRMANSMKGLMMPVFPPESFLRAVREVVKRNLSLGFAPSYDPAWQKESFVAGHSVYIRPFTHAEGGIGVSVSNYPWVVIVTSTVGSYFRPGNSKAITTSRIRATQGGTGWIKAASNYVISALAKKEAEVQGYMECMFLDGCEHRYFEEGSSCNLFFLLANGTLVTPSLEDTILPGITRASVIELARELGVKVEERKISVEEVLADAREVFATGTAAGVSHFESLTHEGREVVFNNRRMGELAARLLKNLKEIQYGVSEDRRGWMVAV
jgi:branched-chain amino acid aminotransferase